MRRLVTEGAPTSDASANYTQRRRVQSRSLASKKRTIVTVIVGIVAFLGVLATIYGIGVYFFMSRYFIGTSVLGIDASGMSKNELEQTIAANVQSYKTKVTGDMLDFEVAAPSIDLSCDAHEVAERIMSTQDAYYWPLSIFDAGRNQTALLSFDTTKLAMIVSTAVAGHNKSAVQPVPATFRLNDQNDGFVVEPEKQGTVLLPNLVYRKIESAVERGESSVTIGSDELAQPKAQVNTPDFDAALNRANNALRNTIQANRDDKSIRELTPEVFAPWLKVRDDLTLEVDQKAAAAWADENLPLTADYSDNTNAYVVDANAFARQLSECVRWGDGTSLQIPFSSIKRYLPGKGKLNPTAWNPDLGRYIDVNIKSQAACLFDSSGRVLWEATVTTGNESTNSSTPEGQFAIYDKKTDFVLLGFDNDNDGKPDYRHPVDYWMPFNAGVGFHDADWRSAFGGEVYRTEGSGGCVNLQKEPAKMLYSMAHVDDTVIVHK